MSKKDRRPVRKKVNPPSSAKREKSSRVPATTREADDQARATGEGMPPPVDEDQRPPA